MFQDISISKNLNKEYKTKCDENSNHPPIDLRFRIYMVNMLDKPLFSVKLLTMGSWPYNQTFTMEIPKVFEETLNNFTTFYHEKHTGRTLTWLYSQSKVFPVITLVEIKCVFPMVVVSILPHAEFGLIDHREGALYFLRKPTISEFYLG